MSNTKTKEQRREEIKSIAIQFTNDVKRILGKRVLKTTFSANINYNSNVNIVLGMNYFNQSWFVDRQDELNALLRKYGQKDTSITFAFNELSNLIYML